MTLRSLQNLYSILPNSVELKNLNVYTRKVCTQPLKACSGGSSSQPHCYSKHPFKFLRYPQCSFKNTSQIVLLPFLKTPTGFPCHLECQVDFYQALHAYLLDLTTKNYPRPQGSVLETHHTHSNLMVSAFVPSAYTAARPDLTVGPSPHSLPLIRWCLLR